MNDHVLEHFRAVARAMAGPEPQDWEWVGPHLSQRMFGISEARAKAYAERFGGQAKKMSPPAPNNGRNL